MKYKQLLLLGAISLSALANVIEVSTVTEYDQKVNNSKKPAIVKFAADWCSICQGSEKPFKEVAQEKEFKNVNFVNVNIGKAKEVSEKNGIVGVPTFFYVAQGKKISQEVGVENMDTFKEDIRNNIREKLPLEVAPRQAQGDRARNEIVADEDGIVAIEIEKTEPVQESTGIMGMVKGAINWVVCAVKMAVMKIMALIKSIFGWIKGLFS